jgi:hypothetical protein
MVRWINFRFPCALLAVALCVPSVASAAFVQAPLTNSSQILTPGGGYPNLVAALNFRFASQATVSGSINGMTIQNFDWLGAPQALPGGGTLAITGFADDRSRFQNTAGTITGTGTSEAVLEAMANTIDYLGANETQTFSFSGLPANRAVQVQFVGGDAASSFNNWNGKLDLVANGTPIGLWNAGTEPNDTDAKIATFDAITNGTGGLTITATQTVASNFAGIAGMFVVSVPEPGSATLLIPAAAILAACGWRRTRFGRRCER